MAKSHFPSLLRKHGYKATQPRLAVLAAFQKDPRPLSAQGIIDKLSRSGKASHVDIDQATVYRTLDALKTAGIIRQVDLRHNHAHYELADTPEHHHIICTHCGRIEDVRHCGIEEVQAAALRHSSHFAAIAQHSLEFYGICKKCANA